MASSSGRGINGNHHNDRWDPSFRRELRQELRENIINIQKEQDEIEMPDEFISKLDEENKLYKKVVSSREAVLDSECFKLLSKIACYHSQSSRGELIHFNPSVYGEKLLTYMGGQLDEASTLDWCKLGTTFLRCFRVAPSGQFLFGSLEPVAVPTRNRLTQSQRPSTAKGKLERPRELSSLGEEAEVETTTRDVQHIFTLLKSVCNSSSDGRVHYFRFLIDPQSFSHSVENIFHFSFLIKEGRAGVVIGDDGQPYVFVRTLVISQVM
jgi:hypothetical protein